MARSRLRLLVQAVFLPGSARDGEIAEWCEDYTDHQAEKLWRLKQTGTPCSIQWEGEKYAILVTAIDKVDPRELGRVDHEMSPLVPVSRVLGTYPDPEHLG